MSVWTYTSAHLGPLGAGITAAAAGVLALLLIGRGVTWIARSVPSKATAAATDQGSKRQRMTFEDFLTFLVAVAVSVAASQGMWNFFGDKLDINDDRLRVVMFAVFEASMLVCALRTRRRIKEELPAGMEGPAVWVLAGLSGLLSATDTGPVPGKLARLALPLVAAFLWERGLSIERAKTGAARKINWRLTPERILVSLGVAEPTAQTAGEVDARRHMTRVALAAHRMNVSTGWRQGLARRRLRWAMRRAVTRTGLADDVKTQDVLMGQLGALCNLDALSALRPPAPWDRPEPAARPASVRVVMLPPTAYMPKPDAEPVDAEPVFRITDIPKADAIRYAAAATGSEDPGDVVAWLEDHGRTDVERRRVGEVMSRSGGRHARQLSAVPDEQSSQTRRSTDASATA